MWCWSNTMLLTLRVIHWTQCALSEAISREHLTFLSIERLKPTVQLCSFSYSRSQLQKALGRKYYYGEKEWKLILFPLLWKTGKRSLTVVSLPELLCRHDYTVTDIVIKHSKMLFWRSKVSKIVIFLIVTYSVEFRNSPQVRRSCQTQPHINRYKVPFGGFSVLALS